MQTKEQIVQEIRVKRGEYTRARFKKFQRLRHLKQLGIYYWQKRGVIIRRTPKPEMVLKETKKPLLKRILNWFRNLFQRVGNRFKINKKEQPTKL